MGYQSYSALSCQQHSAQPIRLFWFLSNLRGGLPQFELFTTFCKSRVCVGTLLFMMGDSSTAHDEL